jgi:hypothetical protein
MIRREAACASGCRNEFGLSCRRKVRRLLGHANKTLGRGAGLLLAELTGGKVSTREADRSKRLVSYIAAVPSAWEFLYGKASKILGLNTITNQA